MPIHWGNIHCMTILDIFKSCKSTFPTMLLYSLTEDHFVLVLFSWLNPNKNMSSFIWCHTNNTGLRLQYNDRDRQVVTLKLGDIWIQINNYHMRCTNSNNWTKNISFLIISKLSMMHYLVKEGNTDSVLIWNLFHHLTFCFCFFFWQKRTRYFL